MHPDRNPAQLTVEIAFTVESPIISRKSVTPSVSQDIQALEEASPLNDQIAGITSMKSILNPQPSILTNKTKMIYLLSMLLLTPRSKPKREIYCTMEINAKQVELKIDTGAKCNVITLDLFKRIRRGEEIIKSGSVQLVAYGGDTFTTMGTANFDCHLGSTDCILEFHVVDKPVSLLLGLVDSLSLNLIHLHREVHEVDTADAFRTTMLDQYKDLFQG